MSTQHATEKGLPTNLDAERSVLGSILLDDSFYIQAAGTLEALQAENRRLQRELHRVAQQRDILKKTLGIISEPSGTGLNG